MPQPYFFIIVTYRWLHFITQLYQQINGISNNITLQAKYIMGRKKKPICQTMRMLDRRRLVMLDFLINVVMDRMAILPACLGLGGGGHHPCKAVIN